MPPTYVEVAQYDPLRDEGLAFATRLLAAGTDVEIHLFAGTFHGSEMLVSADVSQRANSVRIAALRQGLASTVSERAG
jgi:acetyl esterase/lipase